MGLRGLTASEWTATATVVTAAATLTAALFAARATRKAAQGLRHGVPAKNVRRHGPIATAAASMLATHHD